MPSCLLITRATVIAALYDSSESSYVSDRVYDSELTTVTGLHAGQDAAITVARVINKQEGIYGIPIDDAIELVVRDLRAETSGSAEKQP